MKVYNIPYYTCGCGYETSNPGNASRHKKVECGCEMSNSIKEFVLKEDYDRKEVVPQTVYNGNVGTVDNSINVNITLAVPDRSAVEAVYDVFKKPEFISEIRGADPQQIPAILFRHTRGVCADQKFIQYDSDKNVVVHKDPVTGKDTTKDLKKYRNEYLKESANLFDDDYHIPYAPPNIQRALKDMTKPSFDTGKKKEKPISGAQVIKMCATGDHRMYKFPTETKEFYDDIAKNVDVEIKSTDKLL